MRGVSDTVAAYVLGILGAVCLALLAFCLYAYRTAFHTAPHDEVTAGYEPPSSACTPQMRERLNAMRTDMRSAVKEEIVITSRDGLRLVGDYYEAAPHAPLHIAFHGYRSSCLSDSGGAFRMTVGCGHNLLAVDQRAHGRSDGRTITFGIRESEDLLCWVDYACERFGHEVPIFLHGISMGGATVLTAVGRNLPSNVVGVLSDCAYTSTRDILCEVVRHMHLPVRLSYLALRISARIFGGFDTQEVSAIEAVGRATVPIFFAHGEADTFVPFAMVHRLYEACASDKVLFTVKDATHGMSYMLDEVGYEDAVHAFEKRCLALYEKKATAQ